MEKLPTFDIIEEAGVIAVGLSKHLSAREQAFFIAGFQEAVKYLQPSMETQMIEMFALRNRKMVKVATMHTEDIFAMGLLRFWKIMELTGLSVYLPATGEFIEAPNIWPSVSTLLSSYVWKERKE